MPNLAKMRRQPHNGSLHQFVDLVREYHLVYVDLQPGDATRYELLVCRISTAVEPMGSVYARVGIPNWDPEDLQEGLFVTRLVAGRPIGSVVVLPRSSDEAFEPLSNGNGWSQTLLAWWIRDVFLPDVNGAPPTA